MGRGSLPEAESAVLKAKGGVSYVLEAAVEDLELLAGEAGLGLQLLQALGAMADCRQLQLIFDAVCKEETCRCEQSAGKQRRTSRPGISSIATPELGRTLRKVLMALE